MEKSLTSKILSIKCLSHDEPVTKLCLEPSCIDRRLVCVRCCKDKQPHQGHNIKPLKTYLQEMEQDTSEACMVQCLEKIQTLKTATHNNLNRVKQGVLVHFDQTKQKLDQIFNENRKRINSSFSTINSKVKDMHNLANHNIITETHLRDLSKILGEFAVLNQHITSNRHQQVIRNAIQQFQKFINNIQIHFDEQFAPSEKLLSNQSLQIAQLHSKKSALINWSDTLKGGRIVIIGPRVERRADNNWLAGMALSDSPISLSSKTSWGFKISHYSFYCIYMGIALKNQVIKNNYNFQNRGSIGHGCYMVDTNGNAFSHTQKQFNNVYMMKEFNKTQSIVYLSFDPFKNKLMFRLEDSSAPNSKFELNVAPLPKGDFYYIAVFLRGVNNSVELITQNIPQ